jgi:O-glycosyl hydrolase
MLSKEIYKVLKCSLIATVIGSAVLPVPSARAATTVSLDPSYQQKPFNGWGTALAWFGNITGGWPDATRNALADALYSTAGLQFNIVRYNIGAGDNPCTNYMRPGAEVPSYLTAPGQWDWTADANQRWWVQAAKSRGANTFEAFSNSPPSFMTVSGCTSGNTDANMDNIKSTEYNNFAVYLAEVVKHFRDSWGITFQSLSPVNEPNTNYWRASGSQEGSHWSPASQARIIDESRAELSERGLSTVVAAMDETSVDMFVTNWDNYNATTRANIGQLNTHTYGGTKRTAVRDIAKGTNKTLWMSEVDLGGGTAHNHHNIVPGLALAEKINADLKELEPNAWVLWQAIESEQNMINENLNWGLIHANWDTGAWEYTKKYYVMGNYSKFIRPGYRIINTNQADTVAAMNTSGQQLIIVQRNASSSNMAMEYDLSGFLEASGSAVPYVTSSTDNLAQKSPIPLLNKKLTATVGANSVTTFVVSGVSGVAKQSIDSTAYYRIVNKNSGKVLDVSNASLQSGTKVIQWSNNGGYNQHWRIEPVNGGYYKLTNRNSGFVLDLEQGSLLTGASLIQWPWNGGANQQWTLSTSGDGNYTLLSRHSGLLVDVNAASQTDGASIIQWSPNGNANQQWTLVKVP